jgi:hypothetical protein
MLSGIAFPFLTFFGSATVCSWFANFVRGEFSKLKIACSVKPARPREIAFQNPMHHLERVAGDGRDLLRRASGLGEQRHSRAAKIVVVQKLAKVSVISYHKIHPSERPWPVNRAISSGLAANRPAPAAPDRPRLRRPLP